MSVLETWASKLFGVVSESGSTARRIRLTSDGQTWDTWDAPFATPAEWAKEAESLLNALTSELPVRRISMVFTAEDATGAVLSQLPRSVMGTNKQAAEIGTHGGAKALAEALASVAHTMDDVLKAAREQLNTQGERIRADAEEIRALHELYRAQRERDLLEQVNSGAVDEFVQEQLKQGVPLALEAFGAWLDSYKKTAATKAASKTIASATKAAPAVNGATPK